MVGRDTRGLIRMHQFHKVELVKLARPDESYAELESMTKDAEGILESIKNSIPHNCLINWRYGIRALKTYDIEAWIQLKILTVEISSCSNTEAFQAPSCKKSVTVTNMKK